MAEVWLCKEIRRVRGGYLVEARWPYGPEVSGAGKVICKTMNEVIALIRQCDVEEEP